MSVRVCAWRGGFPEFCRAGVVVEGAKLPVVGRARVQVHKVFRHALEAIGSSAKRDGDLFVCVDLWTCGRERVPPRRRMED